ncbi:hypothetical protein EVAR_75083_1 [Eumeta japonica]|uniref:Uncharacterized protein n=1 Tax=Eumeta variegata TaxID=151549 RepID=A0A4C1VZE6_EUMVA|nr:hypothetical protein EVAR_75083_1 [Eumeta japonica]
MSTQEDPEAKTSVPTKPLRFYVDGMQISEYAFVNTIVDPSRCSLAAEISAVDLRERSIRGLSRSGSADKRAAGDSRVFSGRTRRLRCDHRCRLRCDYRSCRDYVLSSASFLLRAGTT